MSTQTTAFNTLTKSLIAPKATTDSCLNLLNKNKQQRTTQGSNKILQAQATSGLYDGSNPSTTSQESLDKSETLGKGWFNLKPLPMDDKLKREIQVIQMRNYIDPKRFYKNPDKPGPVLHIGTVVEGPFEYKSSRLTKRERKETLVEELLADESVRKYSKRVFTEIQKTKQAKRKFGFHDKKSKKKSKAHHALF